MSRISRKTQLKTTTPEPVSEVQESPELHFAENKVADEHIARVVFEANASAEQLARGHVVRLTGAKNIFNGATEETDMGKGIITGIKTCSIFSDCSESVTLSLNLFNTSEKQPNVQNEQGWLHAPQHTDFGAMAADGGNGYKNLVNILPFEKSRVALVSYKPEDVANDRYIQQYGAYTNDNLYEGVVSFPGEQYYLVQQGHVVLNVIKNNWEQLGINVDDEHRFNGKYVQVPTHVFDRVIKDLEAQVLSRMPFTDLNDIRAQFSTKKANSYNTTHEEGAEGKYKVIVELGISYQFPPTTKNEE